MAIEVSKELKSGSVVLLLARDLSDLQTTKSTILLNNAELHVFNHVIDLSSPTTKDLQECFAQSLFGRTADEFEQAIIVHNVGTIGDVTKAAVEFNELKVWSNYFSLNVFSVSSLNSNFMQYFNNVKKLVINITSLCSSVPFKSFTLYCTSRAAREMYFNVLALENPETLVLNYSPGTVDTNMITDVQTNSADAGLRDFFASLKSNNSLVSAAVTSKKMKEFLAIGNFKSGDHVDYNEIIKT